MVVNSIDTTASFLYLFAYNLGSYNLVLDHNKATQLYCHYDPWGNRKLYTDWNANHTSGSFLFDRGFTGHEHLEGFKIINMNARLYDPVIGRFFSPDPQVQSPTSTQSYNRYSYCMNNPIMFNDPDGESLIAAMLIGGAMNWGLNGFQFNWKGLGHFAVGALGGLVGAGIGMYASHAIGVTTTLGGSIEKGIAVGAISGFGGGFVGGAENSLVGGSSLGQGLEAGFKGGMLGYFSGGLIGGIVGGFQYRSNRLIFRRGCSELSVNPEDGVPATDEFLRKAQQAWFKNAPMDKVKVFTVENVPAKNQRNMDMIKAAGSTSPENISKKFSGMSDVFFNKNIAFSSAKQLFYTMGHEFVHVSQFAALQGSNYGLTREEGFYDMLDYHAYSYQNSVGGLQYNSYTREDLIRWSQSFPQFNSMNYIHFPWTSGSSFSYPF